MKMLGNKNKSIQSNKLNPKPFFCITGSGNYYLV